MTSKGQSHVNVPVVPPSGAVADCSLFSLQL